MMINCFRWCKSEKIKPNEKLIDFFIHHGNTMNDKLKDTRSY